MAEEYQPKKVTAKTAAVPLVGQLRKTPPKLDDDLVLFFKLMIAGHKPV